MGTISLAELKNRLIAEKKSITETITHLEDTGIGNTMSDSVGELSMYDNHPADLGDVMFERSKDVAIRDNEHILLEQIEAALDKMAAGNYGVCEKCGQTIHPDRLDAEPWAALCIACQRKTDIVDNTPRPLEEEILAPPFHRTFLDRTGSDEVGFDGEDSLQGVLRFGSSDSPQDILGSKDYKTLWPNSNEHIGIVDLADAIPSDHRKTRSPANAKAVEKLKNSKEPTK